MDLFGVPQQLNVWDQDNFFWMIDTKIKICSSEAHGLHDWIQRGAIWVRDAQNQEILIDSLLSFIEILSHKGIVRLSARCGQRRV